MASYSTKYNSEFSAKQLFELVKDVEKYPEFLPWCSAARILSKRGNTIEAELTVHLPPLSHTYTSKVTLFPPIKEDDNCKIEVELLEGPFEYLNNSWQFTSKDNQTEVLFLIDFQCSSRFLEKMIGTMFESALQKMKIAFQNRARKIYHVD